MSGQGNGKEESGWNLGLPAGWARVAGSLTVVAVMAALLAYLVVVGAQTHAAQLALLRDQYELMHTRTDEVTRVFDRLEARQERILQQLSELKSALREKRPEQPP